MKHQNYLKFLIFSDEATFTTNGNVSSQNCRFWSKENPNFIINTRSQHYKKVNIWSAITYDKIIGPYFFERNFNQFYCLGMLDNYFLDKMENFNLDYRMKCVFQQDECPTHSTRLISDWCSSKFVQNWIGRYGPIFWPPHSPGLTPCDFHL
ncbi:hypothetical protein ILUMI_12114 [Ignelater luminosus]|uniref:Transposase n=1 Tax=Ignelater luminosus TaxID=2038154 RepID=A0A8K0GC40_IGNLU|nr:hypothetical protein ILUMI_12114 [Ignelater luminosus]